MDKKHIKTKIGVGSVAKNKDGEMEDKIREVRTRIMRKEVVVFVHDLMGKNIILVQFQYGQNKEMSSCLLVSFFWKRRLIWISQNQTFTKKNKVKY